jgi:hypothetical protein
LVLAGLDPLSSLAIADPEALNALLETDVDGQLSGLFAPEPAYEDDQSQNYVDQSAPAQDSVDGEPIVRGDNEYVLLCPDCGNEFSVTVDEE